MAKLCALAGRYEYALNLQNDAAGMPESASLSAAEKRKLYADLAVFQTALHRDDDAAKSLRMANSFLQ